MSGGGDDGCLKDGPGRGIGRIVRVAFGTAGC